MNSKKHLQQLNFESLSIPPTINELDELMSTSDSPMPPTLSRLTLMNTPDSAPSSISSSNAEVTPARNAVESDTPNRMDICEPSPKMPTAPLPSQALMNNQVPAPSFGATSSNAQSTSARNFVESPSPERMDVCEPTPKMPPPPRQALINTQNPAPSSISSLNAQSTSARNAVESDTPNRMDISGPSPKKAAISTPFIPGRFGCSPSFNNRPLKRRFINSSLYVNGNEETVERLQKELAESKSNNKKLQAEIAKRDGALSLQQQSQQQNIELTEMDHMLSQELEKRSLEKKEWDERMEKMQQEFLIATNSWGSVLDHFQAFRHLMNNTLAQKEIDYAKSVECNQKLLAENEELKKMRTREEYEKAQTEILKLRILRDQFLEEIDGICKKLDKWKTAASDIP